MQNSKKRILLINSHFGMGGIESALVNMANQLCEQYDVDVLVYNPQGPMKERLDKRVNILKSSFALRAIGMSFRETLKTKNPLIILFRLLGTVWSRIVDNRLPIWIATALQSKLCGYDLAIAYRQEIDRHDIMSGFVRALDRCVESKVKVAWIHYDATFFERYHAFNEKYYKKVDKIIGVSKAVSEAFVKMNPDLADKIDYCYNFIDMEMLIKKSDEAQSVKYPEHGFVCFSASRLNEEKAIERTISAIAPTMHEHKDIVWYIAGDGPKRTSIEAAAAKEDLSDRIIILGNQSNPYPYMKNADLFMLTSYHEAAPVVYMEAKTLGVPVFTTQTLSSYEMLKDGVEDFICENSEEGIRNKFNEIMKNRNLVCCAKAHITQGQFNNEESLKKLSLLMNN